MASFLDFVDLVFVVVCWFVLIHKVGERKIQVLLKKFTLAIDKGGRIR